MASWLPDIQEAQDTLHVLVQQQTSLGGRILKQFPAQHVLRIFQVDAMLLESEVMSILTNALNNVLSVGQLELFRFRYPDELQLILQLILYKFGIWDCNQHVWDRMQNLVYRNERIAVGEGSLGPLAVVASQRCAPTVLQKCIHLVLSIVAPYLFRKLLQRSLDENWGTDNGRESWKPFFARSLKWISNVVQGVSLLHLLWFLMEGKYRSPVDRLVGMRLVHGDQRMRRLVNLMYLNQHVAWQAWSSFLSALSPVLNIGRTWDQISSVGTSVLGSVGSGQDFLREGHCCACREPAVLGKKSNCGHLYCYHCIASRLRRSVRDTDDTTNVATTFPCMHCGATVHSMS